MNDAPEGIDLVVRKTRPAAEEVARDDPWVLQLRQSLDAVFVQHVANHPRHCAARFRRRGRARADADADTDADAAEPAAEQTAEAGS